MTATADHAGRRGHGRHRRSARGSCRFLVLRRRQAPKIGRGPRSLTSVDSGMVARAVSVNGGRDGLAREASLVRAGYTLGEVLQLISWSGGAGALGRTRKVVSRAASKRRRQSMPWRRGSVCGWCPQSGQMVPGQIGEANDRTYCEAHRHIVEGALRSWHFRRYRSHGRLPVLRFHGFRMDVSGAEGTSTWWGD